MIKFPNAKINLGLNIISKRSDNYHNIETIFYPIGLKDVLEVVPSASNSDYSLSVTGIDIDEDHEKNLVVKAYKLLKSQYTIPNIDIFLHKIIPFAAGLGGGSADASFMLKILRDEYHLPVDDKQLEVLAATLGADCAFFCLNKPVLARGIGNEFEPINLSLKGYNVVLIKPDINIPTFEAYASVKPVKPEYALKDVVKFPVEEWRYYMKNDFERSVFPKHPVIDAIKEQLYRAGAVYASMSGSGSAVYGLFKSKPEFEAEFKDCFIWTGPCEY